VLKSLIFANGRFTKSFFGFISRRVLLVREETLKLRSTDSTVAQSLGQAFYEPQSMHPEEKRGGQKQRRPLTLMNRKERCGGRRPLCEAKF